MSFVVIVVVSPWTGLASWEMSYQKYKFLSADIFQTISFVDSHEPSVNSFPLHFHYSFIKQTTGICDCPTGQTSLGGPGWFRASCKNWGRGPASHRGQVYQLVTALLRTGKMGTVGCNDTYRVLTLYFVSCILLAFLFCFASFLLSLW